MKGSGARSIIINSSFLGAAKIIASISRAIYVIAIAYHLGPQLYGAFSYGTSWYLYLLPISMAGLRWVIPKEMGRHPKNATNLISCSFELQIAFSTSFCLLSIIIAFLTEPSPAMQLLIMIFSIALFGRSIANWSNSVFIALENSRIVLMIETLMRILEVICGIALLYLGFGILALAMLHAVIWALQAGLSVLRVIRIKPFRLMPFNHLPQAFSLLKQGLPYAISPIFGSWMLQGPLLMYRHIGGVSDALGQLSLALQAFMIIAMPLGEVGTAALPVLSRAIHRKDDKASLYIREILRIGWILGGILLISAYTLAPSIIHILFENRFSDAAQLLPWSLSLVTLYFFTSSFHGLVGIHGHFGSVVISNLVGAAIFTLSFPFLVSHFDTYGTLVSMAIGLATVVTIQLLVLHRHHRLQLLSSSLKPICGILIGLAFAYLTHEQEALVSFASGLAAMLLTWLVTGTLSLKEIEKLRSPL